MSYGPKYKTSVAQLRSGNVVQVSISKKDYSGAITTLKTASNGVHVILDDSAYFDSIVATSCTIEIINNLSDFFELDDLFSVNDMEYLVEIYDNNYYYFAGYIPCDVVEQKFMKNGTITINAGNNVKRLGEYRPTIFTIAQGYSLIEIIQHCIAFTGLGTTVFVNSTLREDSQSIAGNHTTFDRTYAYSDLFLENDIDFKDCLTILQDILRTMDCKMYWWNNKWYIDRIKDLGTANKKYVWYMPDGSVVFDTEPNTVLSIGNANNKLRFANSNQTIAYVPGVKQVKLSLAEDVKLNFVDYYFDSIITITRSYAEVYYPGLRTWQKENTTTSTSSPNTNAMTNCVLLFNTYIPPEVATYRPEMLADSYYIDFINLSDIPFFAQVRVPYVRSSLAGLYTRFRFSTNASSTTTMTIKYKFKLPSQFLAVMTQFTSDKDLHPANHRFKARFFIRNPPGSYFVKKNSGTGLYELVYRPDIITTGGVIDPAIIEVEINFSNFTDRVNCYHEFTVDIPIDDFKSSLVSREFILGIVEIGYYNNVASYWMAIKHSIIGDVIVTINNDAEDNVVTGNVNLGFVEVLEEEVVMYDVVNNNILNGLYNDRTVLQNTNLWVDASGATSLPITKKMIEDRFQIYNKVRRELRCDLIFTQGLKPFTLINEEHFTNNFYLSGFTWDIEESTYRNAILKEYVGNDNIT